MSDCKHHANNHCARLGQYGYGNIGIPDAICNDSCDPTGGDKQDDFILHHALTLDEHFAALKKKHPKNYEFYRQRARSDADAVEAIAPELSKLELVKNLGRHSLKVVSHWRKTRTIFVSDEVRTARDSICAACEKVKYDKGRMRCGLKSCGCHLEGEWGRNGFAALPCDLGKHANIEV